VAMSFIAHVMQEVVNQKVRCDKASGCKYYYIERNDWLSIISIYVRTTMIELTLTVRLCVM